MAIMSYEERQKIQRALADEQLKKAAQQRRQDDAIALNTAQQTVDKQVQETTDTYRQKQQEAAETAWEELERNALEEELGRQTVEQRMANLGLANSGLAASSQEAVTTRRDYRDRQETRRLSDYVEKLEEAIAQAQAEGNAKKAALQETSDANFHNWYASLEQKTYANADKTAAQLYNNDLKAQQAIEKAKAAAAKAQAAAKKQTATSKTNSSAKTSTNKNTTAKTQPTAKPTTTTATPSPSGNAPTTPSSSVTRALDAVSNWDASSGGIFNKTFWSGPDGDGQNVYEDIVQEQLFASQPYKRLSTAEKNQAIAMAIGKSIATTWPGKGDALKNITRLRSALLAAQKELKWDQQTLVKMQEKATEVYTGLT